MVCCERPTILLIEDTAHNIKRFIALESSLEQIFLSLALYPLGLSIRSGPLIALNLSYYTTRHFSLTDICAQLIYSTNEPGTILPFSRYPAYIPSPREV